MSAHDVAAELRRRLPNLPTKKLHNLLYYCQGHHLAHFDEPLFSETISAFDMGPVVAPLWWAEKNGEAPAPQGISGEAELNTIDYVVSRYGKLSGKDLEILTHAEAPYRLADEVRAPGTSARIELEWIKEFFRTAGPGGEDEDEDDDVDRALISAWVHSAAPMAPVLGDVRVDSREGILARLGVR
jgi:uncharacterized phage-associated protein